MLLRRSRILTKNSGDEILEHENHYNVLKHFEYASVLGLKS